jgi:hypothetical protein
MADHRPSEEPAVCSMTLCQHFEITPNELAVIKQIRWLSFGWLCFQSAAVTTVVVHGAGGSEAQA